MQGVFFADRERNLYTVENGTKFNVSAETVSGDLVGVFTVGEASPSRSHLFIVKLDASDEYCVNARRNHGMASLKGERTSPSRPTSI